MIIDLTEYGKTPMIGGLCFNYQKPYIRVYTQLMHHDPNISAYPIWFFEVDENTPIEVGDYYIEAECGSIRRGLHKCNEENHAFVNDMYENSKGYFRKVLSTNYPPLIKDGIDKLDIKNINLNNFA